MKVSAVLLIIFMQINDSIKDEIIANQRMVPPGKSLMALNGALINIEDIDLYQLCDLHVRLICLVNSEKLNFSI